MRKYIEAETVKAGIRKMLKSMALIGKNGTAKIITDSQRKTIADGFIEKAPATNIVTCEECKHRIEHHYEEPGEKPYIKSTCGCKYGLTKDYQVHDDDFCSRGEKSKDGENTD